MQDYPGIIRECDRCGFEYEAVKLQEQDGLYICEKCYDEKGFDEKKADNPKDSYAHYFKS